MLLLLSDCVQSASEVIMKQRLEVSMEDMDSGQVDDGEPESELKSC